MNIEDDILIERFLRNQLSESEQKQVVERIETDIAFKEKVDFERELLESLNEDDWHFIEDYNKEQVDEYTSILRTKELTDLKAELKRVNEKHKENVSIPNRFNWKRVLVSSAAVLAIMFSVYLFTNNSTTEELYVEYLNISDLPSLVSRDDSTNQLTKAQELFEDANYSDALTILNKAMINEEGNASLLLYKGISEMELNKFAKAEETFNILINSDLLDAQKGHWYKVLLYLKQDDKMQAKSTLEDIVSQSYYNTEKAKALLGKLD